LPPWKTKRRWKWKILKKRGWKRQTPVRVRKMGTPGRPAREAPAAAALPRAAAAAVLEPALPVKGIPAGVGEKRAVEAL
jgi:hypothetical protein